MRTIISGYDSKGEAIGDWLISAIALLALAMVFLWIQLRDRTQDSAHQERQQEIIRTAK
jgi:hypothetical protein